MLHFWKVVLPKKENWFYRMANNFFTELQITEYYVVCRAEIKLRLFKYWYEVIREYFFAIAWFLVTEFRLNHLLIAYSNPHYREFVIKHRRFSSRLPHLCKTKPRLKTTAENLSTYLHNYCVYLVYR